MIDCRNFERLWNQRLDDRGAAPREIELALETHSAVCSRCRSIGARYHTLEQAICSYDTQSIVPAGFAQRILERSVPPRRRTLRPFSAVAAAATVLAAVILGVQMWNPRVPDDTPAPNVAVRSIDPRDVSEALAEASSATLVLAREASAPAARLGRQVFESEASSQTTPAIGLRVPDTTDWIPTGLNWQLVGERVGAGFRPLSGTARHAFGFLLETTDSKDKDPHPRSPRGA
jgi:hypothetical protein